MSLRQRLTRLELWAPKVSAHELAARLEAARQEIAERWSAIMAQEPDSDPTPQTPEEQAEAIREIRLELEARAANARPLDAPTRPHRRAHWRR